MKIKIVIDKNDDGTLYVFIGNKDVTDFIFTRQPKNVVNVKKLPGETSRIMLCDDEDYRILSIKSSFEPLDYIQYGSQVEKYLEK